MTNTNFTFSPNTGNATLQLHLERHHTDEYVRICGEKGWPIKLTKMRQEQTAEVSIGQADTQGSLPRPKFSRQTFLRHIINFIIADDQVCFNIFKIYHTYLLLSQLMLLSAANFTISSSSYAMICRTKIFHIEQNFVKPSLRRGNLGSRPSSENLQYIVSSAIWNYLLIETVCSKPQEESVSQLTSGLTTTAARMSVLPGIG